MTGVGPNSHIRVDCFARAGLPNTGVATTGGTSGLRWTLHFLFVPRELRLCGVSIGVQVLAPLCDLAMHYDKCTNRKHPLPPAAARNNLAASYKLRVVRQVESVAAELSRMTG